MAQDGALLAAAAADGRARIRVYAWSRPALSLGYFQELEDVADPAALGARGVDVVKRVSGGGAILHDRELTLSLALPTSHPWTKLSVNASYLQFTQPLLDALRGLGVEASFRGDAPSSKTANCFAGAACPDIVAGGRKLFGSAQRRKGGAVLQHGSLLLDIDRGLWEAVFGARLGQGFTSLRELGHSLTYAGLASAVKKAYFLALAGAAQTGKGFSA